ncbi:MAG TPA: hypothetical protein VJ724_00325, partial [Tahibacter sp.]|nr:hypothetical protein [Tahibacter sp.]
MERKEARPRAFAWFRCAAAVAIFTAILAAGSAVAQELTVAKTSADLVAESEWIAIADLVGATARRNARGNLIVTDFRFRIVQTIEGMPDRDVVLTQGGGTLDGETHHVSDSAELSVGQRYLVFVRPGRDEVFSPFVGGAQGAFLMVGDSGARSLGADGALRDRGALLEEIEHLVAARGAAPPRAPVRHTMPPGTYPAKVYLPLALTPAVAGATRTPEAESAAAITPERGAAEDDAPPQALAVAGTQQIASPDWHYAHLIAPPATINAFPHDWEWHPYEENQLAYWNTYGGNVYLVYQDPDTSWAWGNDRFDLAGWPDDADMMAQFGVTWPADYIGWTFSRWHADNIIVESDTALNPSYCWTLDDAYATDGTGACQGFRQTMLHEVGHAWGLDHPWETQVVSWDSVMNYSPGTYRYPQLYADDTSAVRSAFAGPAIHDALLSLYTVSASSGVGAQAVYRPTQSYTANVRHGDDLATQMSSQFKIENLGTDDIVSPPIDFYLSPNRMSWDGISIYLNEGVGATVPAGWVYTYWLPPLIIPATTPTGNYWFAAFLPNGDADSNNNSAWATQNWNDATVQVHVDNNAPSLVPDTSWQASDFGYIGPAGIWTFTFYGEAGTTYYYSMCPGTGGWADFDTTLSISYGGDTLGYSDDVCDVQSEIAWTAPY